MMSAAKPLYSFHAFLFPFEWKPAKRNGLPLEEQLDLKRICNIMDAARDKWSRMKPWSKPQSLIQYNEANYFYDFVRPVLYGDAAAAYQVHYQHNEAQGSAYVISLESGEQFRLDLDSIGLSFYTTGVGILSFHCYNRTNPDPDAILKINQYGRRLFPPFFATDPEKIGSQAFFDDDRWADGLKGVQKVEIARSIIIEKNGHAWAAEDFSTWADASPNLEHTPGVLRQLLPSALISTLAISPVLDDRMFVVCWYGNDELSNNPGTRNFTLESPSRDWWYKFVFVDSSSKTCQNERMTRQLLREHSNLRWAGYGTLYGVSRYSFVCLSNSLSSLKANYASYIPTHCQTIYFKLAEIALLQRGCVLRFSDEVTAISDLPKKNRALGAHVSSLYKQYIRFVNKIYFREVTAQEQGIELYDLLQKHMRIENQVKDLDREIEELHRYVSLLEEDRRNETLDILTYIGAFFVVPSFVCSFFGISDFQMTEHWGQVAVLCLLSSSVFFAVIRSSGKWRWFFLTVAALLMFYILFIFPAGKI